MVDLVSRIQISMSFVFACGKPLSMRQFFFQCFDGINKRTRDASIHIRSLFHVAPLHQHWVVKKEYNILIAKHTRKKCRLETQSSAVAEWLM
ncbi:unnamed protein product [Musa hybrid cultivar]